MVALFANSLAGRLSDRTTSRWGRRHPWLIAGALGGTAGLAVVALAPSIAAVTAGWCPGPAVVQRLYRRAGRHGSRACSRQPAGNGLRPHKPQPAPGRAGRRGGRRPVLREPCWLLHAGRRRDHLHLRVRTTAEGRPRAERAAAIFAREFFGSFWTSPRDNPDFGWVWLTRFVTYFAAVAPAPYLVYFLTSRAIATSDSVATTVAYCTTISYVISAVTAAACGWLSDRLGRRKVFAGAAGAVLAAGLAILAASSTLAPVYLAQVVLGIGSGLYFAVDMALAIAVLPSSQHMGKDLGVINSSDVLPQSIGPALAPLLLATGSGHNYTALYLFSMVVGFTGLLTVTRIQTVN